MVKYTKQQNGKIGLKEIIFVVLIIFFSDDTLLFGTNMNSSFIYAKMYGAFVICILLMLYDMLHGVKYNFKPFIYVVLMIVISIINMVVVSDFSNGNYFRMCLIVLGALYVNRLDFDTFAEIYSRIMTLVAVVSVIGTLICIVNIDLFSFAPTVTNSVGAKFYCIGIFNAPISYATIRNYGFAREPGVFQFYLILAIALQLLKHREKYLLRLIALISALLLTFSTTGYLSLIVLCMMLLMNKELSLPKKSVLICILVGAALLVLSLGVNGTIDLSYVLFGKLQNYSSHSSIARLGSLFADLFIFLQYPVFGAGIQRVAVLFPEIVQLRYGMISNSNTNTVLFQFAAQGFVYGMMFVVPFLSFSGKLTQIKYQKILLCIVLLFSACGENHTYATIIYVLIFYGLEYLQNKKYLGGIDGNCGN